MEGLHFGCVVSIGAGLEMRLKSGRGYSFIYERWEHESLVGDFGNRKWISVCWSTHRAKLLRADGGSYPAWGTQWVDMRCG